MARRVLVTSACMIGMLVPASAADKASGYFRMDTVTSKLSAACAFRVPHPEKSGDTQTTIVLATQAIDCAAADRTFDPIGAVAAQVKAAGGAYVQLTPREGASGTDGSWTQVDPYDSMGSADKANSCTRFAATHGWRVRTRPKGLSRFSTNRSSSSSRGPWMFAAARLPAKSYPPTAASRGRRSAPTWRPSARAT